MRNFWLLREEDVSGKSGTGYVAQGCEFDDGTVCTRWMTATPSTGFYNSIEDVIAVHGHEGRTNVVWTDSDGKT